MIRIGIYKRIKWLWVVEKKVLLNKNFYIYAVSEDSNSKIGNGNKVVMFRYSKSDIGPIHAKVIQGIKILNKDIWFRDSHYPPTPT